MKITSTVAISAMLYNLTILGACTYLVFWRGVSGWWYGLALLLCCSISKDE